MTRPLPPSAPRKKRGAPVKSDAHDDPIFFRPFHGDGARLQAYVEGKGTTIANLLRGYVQRLLRR